VCRFANFRDVETGPGMAEDGWRFHWNGQEIERDKIDRLGNNFTRLNSIVNFFSFVSCCFFPYVAV
jgi:hypothetical protein